MAKPSQAKTKPCTDCGGTVSRQAKTCPHCGAPVKPEQKKMGPMQLFIGPLIGLIVIFFLVSIFTGGEKDEHSGPRLMGRFKHYADMTDEEKVQYKKQREARRIAAEKKAEAEAAETRKKQALQQLESQKCWHRLYDIEADLTGAGLVVEVRDDYTTWVVTNHWHSMSRSNKEKLLISLSQYKRCYDNNRTGYVEIIDDQTGRKLGHKVGVLDPKIY